ncbi:TonB-dependent receptor [Acetobacter nitrogenifigens DSM 23921 = NBRC 105050]|uniref:TonB-dependent receptor n=1 Tax=Acetobacter nitrogenifigens DSM 23921 = NBRC 105050 TaxID=1120919 RepID=A0A511XFA3_9PROT|nr:TonB-dependent receptor [Acetobacter nitrogenifigens]GBQ94891.1 TonB-dependent receptor [Acetobacter nitrogenifigens DSM 23921 = NBRC 105050]GEN61640.1 TonB-dependent receptor [Acetobacter nitrogenifigens DSM 23921 = NBRC 105050]
MPLAAFTSGPRFIGFGRAALRANLMAGAFCGCFMTPTYAATQSTPSSSQPVAAKRAAQPSVAPARKAVKMRSTKTEDIIVTSTKRHISEQHTPGAVSIISAKTLRENNISDIKQLAAILPAVSFAQSNSSVLLGIRGVVSRDTTNPAVALAFDGFYTQAADGLNMSMFDIDHVEVMRGPQGTLAGRNATAGVVAVNTARAVDHFAANLSGGGGNYGAYGFSGMVNVPLTDKLWVRASFQTRDHSGYRKNPVGKDGDDQHTRAGRIAATYQASEKWTSHLLFEYDNVDDVGSVVQAVPQRYNADGSVNVSRQSIPGNGRKFDVPYGGFEHGDAANVRWDTSYDLGFANITYLGGWRHLNYARNNTLGGAYGSNVQNYSYNSNEHISTLNNEIRLSGKEGKRYFWQVGGFFFRETNRNYTTFSDYKSNNIVSGRRDIYIYNFNPQGVDSKAVFGQASYNITKKLTADFGIRWTHDHLWQYGSQTLSSLSTYQKTGVLNGVAAGTHDAFSKSRITYHAGLNYNITPINMVYFKFDTGYKSGGFSNGIAYGPEYLTSYEVGSKNRFFNKRLTLNVDAYIYDYTHQQVTQYVGNSPTSQVVNAGASKYYGIEAQGQALLTDCDRFDFYVGYDDAQYTKFDLAQGSGNISLAGKRPPQAPRWNFNLGLEHDFNVLHGMLTARAQTHFQTKTYFTVYNYGADEMPTYHKTDVILTYKPNSGHWQVRAYVQNIENRLILANAQNPSSTTYQAYRYQYMPPRLYGGEFTYTW